MKQEGHSGWNVGNPSYTVSTRIAGARFDDVVQDVREKLADEGFGVLTEIDLAGTMKKKLDIEVPRYLILGACNPSLAHQAITQEPGLGALLPCNVMVAEEAKSIFVGAIDPKAMFSVVDRDDIAPIAEEVRTRLQRVLEAIS